MEVVTNVQIIQNDGKDRPVVPTSDDPPTFAREKLVNVNVTGTTSAAGECEDQSNVDGEERESGEGGSTQIEESAKMEKSVARERGTKDNCPFSIWRSPT